jgi:hypothetical protein
MNCQKFCSVYGGKLIKHIFSSMSSREDIPFFHNEFLAGEVKPGSRTITKMGLALSYLPHAPLFLVMPLT